MGVLDVLVVLQGGLQGRECSGEDYEARQEDPGEECDEDVVEAWDGVHC